MKYTGTVPALFLVAEPEFLNFLGPQESITRKRLRQPKYPPARILKLPRAPGSDSEELIPPAYVAWRARAGIFKPLWSPGIDAKASTPPAYVAWRAGTITLFLVGA
jgi:hypothetical protein